MAKKKGLRISKVKVYKKLASDKEIWNINLFKRLVKKRLLIILKLLLLDLIILKRK